MSTEIVAKFYFEDERVPSAEDTICRMAHVLDEWPERNGEFYGFKVLARNRHTVTIRNDRDLSADELCRCVAGHSTADALLSTATSIRCWRFGEGRPEYGSVGVSLEAWGEAWRTYHYEHPRLGGDAALWVLNCGPFCTPIDAAEEAHREINRHVEENLDMLTGLFFRLVEALNPWSMKVFTDEGLYLPVNAHLAYYRDVAGVLKDIELMAEVWERGLPRHHIGPILHHRADDIKRSFHSWRSPSQQEKLWQSLGTLLPQRIGLSPDTVRNVLATGRFDTYTMPAGFAVLEYPDFLNAFLDRFYLAVLAAARGS